MAHDESADAYIRRMEPPAHDAIHYRQLRNRDLQRAAEYEVRAQRDQVSHMVKERIDDALLEESNNVDELAELFPDVPDLNQGVHDLKWRDRQYTERSNDIVDVVNTTDETGAVEDPDGDLEIEVSGENEGGGNGSNGGNGGNSGGGDGDNFDEPEIRRASPKSSEHTIRHARIMRVGPAELVMTFTTPSQPAGSIKFGIKAAGEQYQKNEESIPIAGIKQTGSLLATATLDGDAVKIEAPPTLPLHCDCPSKPRQPRTTATQLHKSKNRPTRHDDIQPTRPAAPHPQAGRKRLRGEYFLPGRTRSDPTLSAS